MQCAVKLVKELEALTAFKAFIAPFKGDNPDLIRTSKDQQWSDGTPGTAPIYGVTQPNNLTGGATIYFNKLSLQQSTTLSIAATAIHESLHAYLYAIYFAKSPNDADTKSYLGLLADYADNHSTATHAFIQAKVSEIASVLVERDNYSVTDDPNFYLKLTMSGLNETSLTDLYNTLCNNLGISPNDIALAAQREGLSTTNADGSPKYKGKELGSNC